MSSTSAHQQPDNIDSPLNRACVIVVTTAEVYPDPQLQSASAATTSVITTKKPRHGSIKNRITLHVIHHLIILNYVEKKNINPKKSEPTKIRWKRY